MYYSVDPGNPDPDHRVLLTSGTSLAHFAAWRADPVGLRIALERGAGMGPDDLGRMPLHYLAAPTGSPPDDNVADCLQLLLAASVNPQRADGNHQACYLVAARAGNAALVESLAEAGVRLNATDRDGNTGLHLAAGSDNAEHVRLVLAFLGAGVDPRAKNNVGRTARELAILAGSQGVAVLL